MLINELIEKAFSDGYEYALEEQREFGAGSIRYLKKQGKMNINMLSKFNKTNPALKNVGAEVEAFAKQNGYGDYKYRSLKMPKYGMKLAKKNPEKTDKIADSFIRRAKKNNVASFM